MGLEGPGTLMFQPVALLHVTTLGPLSVSACQILVSIDSCTRYTSLTTMPQLRSRDRHAPLGGTAGDCPLGTVTCLPRMNLVLGARMTILPGYRDLQGIGDGHIILET